MSDTPRDSDRLSDQDLTSPAGKDVALPAVLLVDDQPARLLVWEAVLADLPIRCIRALSGDEALALLLKEPFAAIVLDVNMPGLDGFETARLIRSHHRFQKTPILFASGVHITELDRLRGYEIGAIDYLLIPIAPEILRTKITILAELHQRRCELDELAHALAIARAHLEPPDAGSPTDQTQTACVKLADREQYRELFSIVSHDLRNAIAPIYYLIELLLRETANTSPIRPLLHMIRQYSMRISQLADDFEASVAQEP